MPDFRYRSVNAEGRAVAGIATASDESSLASLLQGQGLTLIEADLATGDETAAEARSATPSTKLEAQIKSQELIRFTYNLHAIISAGVPIVKGLESLRDEAEKTEGPMLPVLNGLIQRLRAGDSFSEALHLYPSVFPDLYVNLIAAGEASGNLDLILIDLADNLEWQEEIKGTLTHATIYPAIVLTAVAGLIVLLLTFVVPQFTEIFSKMGVGLPLPTRILIAVGDVFSRFWWVGLGALAGAFVGLKVFARSAKGRLAIASAKLRIPLFGNVVMKIALSRFTKNLSVLTNAGVTITDALLISEKIAGNPVLSRAIAEVRERVMRGEPLAKAFGASPEFPILVGNMVAVGEESGKLGAALSRVSQFYDREVKLGLKRAFSVLEPAITVVLALLVGGIAIAIIMALYKAITLVGQ